MNGQKGKKVDNFSPYLQNSKAAHLKHNAFETQSTLQCSVAFEFC